MMRWEQLCDVVRPSHTTAAGPTPHCVAVGQLSQSSPMECTGMFTVQSVTKVLALFFAF